MDPLNKHQICSLQRTYLGQPGYKASKDFHCKLLMVREQNVQYFYAMEQELNIHIPLRRLIVSNPCNTGHLTFVPSKATYGTFHSHWRQNQILSILIFFFFTWDHSKKLETSFLKMLWNDDLRLLRGGESSESDF